MTNGLKITDLCMSKAQVAIFFAVKFAPVEFDVKTTNGNTLIINDNVNGQKTVNILYTSKIHHKIVVHRKRHTG